MFKKSLVKIIFLILLLPCYAVAASPNLGSFAGNITNFIAGLGEFFMSLFFSIGFGFLVGALIKYKAHRDSPSHVTISNPITLLILAIAFILLGFLIYLSPQRAIGSAAQGGGLTGTNQFN